MAIKKLSIQSLWREAGFKPNLEQKAAIRHVDGPLFLAAGPGSGKTRVLLWRTLNLIVFHDVPPEEIFLSTFTEKAAFQLREGIRALLALVTNKTNQAFDISRMYVGTAHSLCRRIHMDRRFFADGHRHDAPLIMDELGQYFCVSKVRAWRDLIQAGGFDNDSCNEVINDLFDPQRPSASKHKAVINALALFNRVSEECIDVSSLNNQVTDEIFINLLNMYDHYKERITSGNGVIKTDFALLQQSALNALENCERSEQVFRYVIIDEYQDTNTIQERLFFKLAAGHKNICVVGDDDQALYRFRGATVENFVEFPQRCREYLHVKQDDIQRITLSTNYRSLKDIVNFYRRFIRLCDWTRDEDPSRQYRVHGKEIKAHRRTSQTAVVASTPGPPEDVCREIAGFIRRLIDNGKVQDPKQIAFLYPSLKSVQVERMKDALENVGLQVYAPRAGRFLEVDEARDVFGVFVQIFGKPTRGDFPGDDYHNFHSWLDDINGLGKGLLKSDPNLKVYVDDRKQEIKQAIVDYKALLNVAKRNKWDLHEAYDIDKMKRKLHSAAGLSARARRILASARFERFVKKIIEEGEPYELRYMILRATSLDWTVLELFYQICGFDHFKHMFDLAEKGVDEGPICNLGLITQYLARFMDEYVRVLTAEVLSDDQFQRLFFGVYLYTLYRLGESEYEDADDPFPKGRIPFLTIHQAKGLEFPIVVLGNPRKSNRGPQRVEELIRPLLSREGEPMDRLGEFDIMRLFYVALSRAKNLLIIPHWRSQGNYIDRPFRELVDDTFPRINDFDITIVPEAEETDQDLARNYSFTGDYLVYKRCPRQYMIFKKYDLFPSTTQTYAFGRLVHQTLEDLHLYLISRRAQAG
jgi:DNA helicase-2/ATP-dependent DNA helicase PcrA